MSYSWLLFDLDNTLFDFDQSERYALRHTFAVHQLPYQPDYLATYHRINKACWEAFENGEIDQQTLREVRFKRFLAAIDCPADPNQLGATYLKTLASTEFVLPGARELLDNLQQQFQLVAVTNGLKEVQRPRIRQSKMAHYFREIIVSDEIGVSKPHAEFFDYTFSTIGHPAKTEVLIIGDNINSDIRGGLNYGISSCWYNPRQIANPTTLQPTYEVQHLKEIAKILK